MVQLLRDGLIQPIRPQKMYKAHEVQDAFRYMQKGVHIGKVVVELPRSWGPTTFNQGSQPVSFRPDAAYLLIGGLGGLGKAISTWMIERGARYFVYLSRSATGADNQAFVEELESQGASVTLVSGSVSVLADVKTAVAASPKPIAGVLQMSLILRDKSFLDLSIDEWRCVTDPKVVGTWNIHEALSNEKLDFLVLFSSASGATGGIGQANYASANTFLDAFVQFRHQQGLACSAMDIGVVGEIGYVAQNKEVQDKFASLEAYVISEEELIQTLQYSIWQGRPQAPSRAQLFRAENESSSYTSPSQIALGLLPGGKPISDPGNRAHWRHDRRFGMIYNAKDISSTSVSSDDELKTFLVTAESDPSVLDTEEGIDLLSRSIGTLIYTFMMQNIEDLDTSQTLTALGVDSLVTIEIRNWWRRAFVTEVSTLELLDAKTISGLGILAAATLKKKFTRGKV